VEGNNTFDFELESGEGAAKGKGSKPPPVVD
jgi:hypothetical protein